MTPLRFLPLVSVLSLATLSSAANIPKTILPDNVIRCEPDAGCTSQTMDGRSYKVLTTPRFTVMVAVSHEGIYTRADINIFNKTDMPLNLSPEDFRVEVVGPKPKVLLYVAPGDLKDLPSENPLPPAVATANEEAKEEKQAVLVPIGNHLFSAKKETVAQPETPQPHLVSTLIGPSRATGGRVYFERDKHAHLVNVVLPIAGLVFEFPYATKK
jgi:hypothetical protein